MEEAGRRRSVEETWAYLEERDEEMPRDAAGRPFVPAQMPRYDDEALGFSFFKSGAWDGEYRGLSLPRTYFGRSLLERIDFSNTDLSESRMCWNDFVECDFSFADLSGCDMRASIFRDCTFEGARLCGADLRQSTFEGCDFTRADMAGVVAERGREGGCGALDELSDEQAAVVTWTDDPGPEPEGG